MERVIKKLGRSHVVWFRESNRWIEFREPAWYVYSRYSGGDTREEITGGLENRYGLPASEAERFMEEILESVTVATTTAAPLSGRIPDDNAGRRFIFTPFSTRHYNFRQRPVTIKYSSPLTEYYIHRPLAHLETPVSGNRSLTFELSDHDTGTGREEKIYIFSKKQSNASASPGEASFDNPGLLKHHLYKEIANHIYGIADGEWLLHIHASAVTSGSSAILFPSPSGSGKSTLAALLQIPETDLYGTEFRFMSDDFVPVDAASMKAHPFPAAITVKEGSFPHISAYYDAAEDADARFEGLKSRSVRYLMPRFPDGDPMTPVQVKSIVFVNYQPGISFKLKKLSTIKALGMFHDEAWVSHNPLHAQKFIDWFATVPCYRLTYSDTSAAKRAVAELFKK